MKTTFGMAKINWQNSTTAYLIVGITFGLAGLGQYIMDWFVNNGENYPVASGNYLYLLPLCLGIFVPAQNFSKLMNLGGKRLDFFISSLLTYLPAAAAVALVSLVTNLTIDKWIFANGKVAGTLDLYEVFGFMARGPVVAFIQMTFFLTLVACVAHTLTLIQGNWYGWLADALIVAIIAVFTPIAPLRAALAWFFNMIIFNDHALVQILSALVVGAAIYAASLVPIAQKQV